MGLISDILTLPINKHYFRDVFTRPVDGGRVRSHNKCRHNWKEIMEDFANCNTFKDFRDALEAHKLSSLSQNYAESFVVFKSLEDGLLSRYERKFSRVGVPLWVPAGPQKEGKSTEGRLCGSYSQWVYFAKSDYGSEIFTKIHAPNEEGVPGLLMDGQLYKLE